MNAEENNKGQEIAPSPQKHDFVLLHNKTGILVNTNNEALHNYKRAKSKFKKINKIDDMQDQINRLESMLAQILEKL